MIKFLDELFYCIMRRVYRMVRRVYRMVRRVNARAYLRHRARQHIRKIKETMARNPEMLVYDLSPDQITDLIKKINEISPKQNGN